LIAAAVPAMVTAARAVVGDAGAGKGAAPSVPWATLTVVAQFVLSMVGDADAADAQRRVFRRGSVPPARCCSARRSPAVTLRVMLAVFP